MRETPLRLNVRRILTVRFHANWRPNYRKDLRAFALLFSLQSRRLKIYLMIVALLLLLPTAGAQGIEATGPQFIDGIRRASVSVTAAQAEQAVSGTWSGTVELWERELVIVEQGGTQYVLPGRVQKSSLSTDDVNEETGANDATAPWATRGAQAGPASLRFVPTDAQRGRTFLWPTDGVAQFETTAVALDWQPQADAGGRMLDGRKIETYEPAFAKPPGFSGAVGNVTWAGRGDLALHHGTLLLGQRQITLGAQRQSSAGVERIVFYYAILKGKGNVVLEGPVWISISQLSLEVNGQLTFYDARIVEKGGSPRKASVIDLVGHGQIHASATGRAITYYLQGEFVGQEDRSAVRPLRVGGAVTTAGVSGAALGLIGIAWAFFIGRAKATPMGHETRIRIIEELRKCPGLAEVQLRKTLHIGRASLRFHLNVLQRHGLVVGLPGPRPHFALSQQAVRVGVIPGTTRHRVLEGLADGKPRTLAELSTGLNLPAQRSLVLYHLRQLAQLGYVSRADSRGMPKWTRENK